MTEQERTVRKLIAHADLPVLRTVHAAQTDEERLRAALTELSERLAVGNLDFEARQEICTEIMETTDRIHAAALTALA